MVHSQKGFALTAPRVHAVAGGSNSDEIQCEEQKAKIAALSAHFIVLFLIVLLLLLALCFFDNSR